MEVFLVSELKGVAKNPTPGVSLNPVALRNLALHRLGGYTVYGHREVRNPPTAPPTRTDGLDLTLHSDGSLYWGSRDAAEPVGFGALRIVPRAGIWGFTQPAAAATVTAAAGTVAGTLTVLSGSVGSAAEVVVVNTSMGSVFTATGGEVGA